MELRLPPPTSAHEVQFQDVLIKAELLEQAPEVVFLCIVPRAYTEFQMEMTPIMQERFPIMENLLIKELSARGAAAVRID
jgi:Ni,Fe-hydrogenase maturation factor